MANPADEFSSADLKAALTGGLIHEDVMAAIWDISNVPLPFMDRVGTEPVENSRKDWTVDELSDPDITNAVIDGLDNVKLDAKAGERQGNFSQISTKAVSVTTRARHSASIGRSDELAYQVSRRQIELYRDCEAINLTFQASIDDDGDTVAGTLGGFDAWCKTNNVLGATGSRAGYQPATGLVTAGVAGTLKAIAESEIRDMVQQVYIEGGESTVLMTIPEIIAQISQYMFTATARIATLEADQGKSMEKAQALGAVNYFITDFGTLEFVPNRIQRKYDSAAGTPEDVATVFIMDSTLLRRGILHGLRTEELAKTGLADKRQLAVDYTLMVLNEKGQAVIADIDFTLPMLAVPA